MSITLGDIVKISEDHINKCDHKWFMRRFKGKVINIKNNRAFIQFDPIFPSLISELPIEILENATYEESINYFLANNNIDNTPNSIFAY